MSVQKFYGKYRGTVVNNIDPQGIGRIMASVPAVSLLLPTSWCLPCFPVAGKLMGISAIPQIGAGVWIEFEGGDPDYPIWTGCFWGLRAEVPSDMTLPGPSNNPATPSIVLQTTLMNKIVVSDVPGPTGGIILRIATGASITINTLGITISNGAGATITLIGKTVDINQGALTVI